MIHALKTEHDFFVSVLDGEKTFEVRNNDRDFRVGDYLALNELDERKNGYTRDSILVRVTYLLDDKRFCKDGYVIMGFEKIDEFHGGVRE